MQAALLIYLFIVCLIIFIFIFFLFTQRNLSQYNVFSIKLQKKPEIIHVIKMHDSSAFLLKINYKC
ncbi:hypothetical protein RIR_e24999_A0A2I1ECR7_9GLOM [Rhizophagus irregularis DAOM 181602=DAOM 197198]|nr:hypothetical protein RhiirB3_523896 [Rhizophagus irregularis]GET64299.1 hypothetical protein RIR_e24999_A0A2I1ECR7_9GLOM [Rhizophagus irregularis DAOM 181602=DAOM 197198]